MEIADRKSITRLRHSDPTFKALHFRSLNTLSFILDKVSVRNILIDSLEIQPDDSHVKRSSLLLIMQLSALDVVEQNSSALYTSQSH